MGKVGIKTIISPSVRWRYMYTIGHHCIIDDWCYFSCRLEMGDYSHISASCTFLGAGELVKIGNFVDIAPGCRICAASSDYKGTKGLTIPTVEGRVSGDRGQVVLHDHVILGANAVVLPGAEIAEGAVIGALSLVRAQDAIAPWSVYAGIPVKYIGARRRDLVLEQARKAING